jgi:hypothetical protein
MITESVAGDKYFGRHDVSLTGKLQRFFSHLPFVPQKLSAFAQKLSALSLEKISPFFAPLHLLFFLKHRLLDFHS